MSHSNPANKAAYIKYKQQHPFEIDDAPFPVPKDHQVVIRSRALAINPADYGIQKMGVVWSTWPRVIGCDVAGEVVEVGSLAGKRFQKGDRVIAACEQGAFALYPVADMALVARLPERISYVEGSVLPAGLSTAAVSLFHPLNLGLPPPQLEPKERGEVVLVWGGSSSVGSCAIQMLRAAGFDVAAVAGGQNLEYCKALGAKWTFDHADEGVVQKITSALQGVPFAGTFAAVFPEGVIQACAAITSALGRPDHPSSLTVATVLSPVMPVPQPIPQGVRVTPCAFTMDILPDSELASVLNYEPQRQNSVARDVWENWLEEALEKGQMKCFPPAEVAGRGLEGLQDAVDRLGEGVSAKKIVVEI